MHDGRKYLVSLFYEKSCEEVCATPSVSRPLTLCPRTLFTAELSPVPSSATMWGLCSALKTMKAFGGFLMWGSSSTLLFLWEKQTGEEKQLNKSVNYHGLIMSLAL